MTLWLLTEHHFVFLSLKGCCTCSSESTLVEMPHCWKSRRILRLTVKTHNAALRNISTELADWPMLKPGDELKISYPAVYHQGALRETKKLTHDEFRKNIPYKISHAMGKSVYHIIHVAT